MERKLFCQLFTATNCSTLARHALKLICQTTFDSILFKPCGSVVLLWCYGGHVTETQDFQLQTMQMLEASCLFSFKSILLRTSGKSQSIKRTACMLNFIYVVQSKWYLRLKIRVQGPFKAFPLTVAGLTSVSATHLTCSLPPPPSLLRCFHQLWQNRHWCRTISPVIAKVFPLTVAGLTLVSAPHLTCSLPPPLSSIRCFHWLWRVWQWCRHLISPVHYHHLCHY